MGIIENKGGKKLNLTILIMLLLFGIIGFLGVGDYFENLYSQYPLIDHETQCRDKLIKIRNEHGTLLLEMSSGIKIGILPTTFTNSDPSEIYNLLKINDSIIKVANSDTLIIRRNELENILILKSNSKTD